MKYYYQVTAVNAGGESARSNEANATPDLCPTPAGTPGPGDLEVVCGVPLPDPTPSPCPPGSLGVTPPACLANPDADGDGVPDAYAPTLCANENPNFNFDGTCPGSDYSPSTVQGILEDLEKFP